MPWSGFDGEAVGRRQDVQEHLEVLRCAGHGPDFAFYIAELDGLQGLIDVEYGIDQRNTGAVDVDRFYELAKREV